MWVGPLHFIAKDMGPEGFRQTRRYLNQPEPGLQVPAEDSLPTSLAPLLALVSWQPLYSNVIAEKAIL